MNRSTSSAEFPAVIALLLPLTEELAGADAAALAAAPLERLLQTSLGYFIIFELRILDEILEHKKATLKPLERLLRWGFGYFYHFRNTPTTGKNCSATQKHE